MATFEIATEICLGYHCTGSGEFIDAEGTVELSDEQLKAIVELIKENGGETDIDELGLEEKYPDIYQALYEAYRSIAYDAEYKYWLFDGYDQRIYDEPDGFMEELESEGLFLYEPEEEVDEDDLEDAKREAFDEWLDEYVGSLDDDEKVAFIETHYGDGLVDMDGADLDFTVEIPARIVEMAAGEK